MIATSAEVLDFLIPSGGWVIYGNDFESIIYDEGVAPITKKQFDDSHKIVEGIKAEQETKKLSAKAAAEAKLAALGLTADDLKALGLG